MKRYENCNNYPYGCGALFAIIIETNYLTGTLLPNHRHKGSYGASPRSYEFRTSLSVIFPGSWYDTQSPVTAISAQGSPAVCRLPSKFPFRNGTPRHIGVQSPGICPGRVSTDQSVAPVIYGLRSWRNLQRPRIAWMGASLPGA